MRPQLGPIVAEQLEPWQQIELARGECRQAGKGGRVPREAQQESVRVSDARGAGESRASRQRGEGRQRSEARAPSTHSERGWAWQAVGPRRARPAPLCARGSSKERLCREFCCGWAGFKPKQPSNQASKQASSQPASKQARRPHPALTRRKRHTHRRPPSLPCPCSTLVPAPPCRPRAFCSTSTWAG